MNAARTAIHFPNEFTPVLARIAEEQHGMAAMFTRRAAKAKTDGDRAVYLSLAAECEADAQAYEARAA